MVLKIDLFIYSIILLSMVLAILLSRRKYLYPSQRLFIYIVLSSLLLLISELIVTLADGKPGVSARILNVFFNFILHGFSSLPFAFWFAYFEYNIKNDINFVKKSPFNKIPPLLSLIIMIYSSFTGFVYYIDSNNHRVMNSGVFFLYAVNALIFLAAIYLFLRFSNQFDRTTKTAYISFIFIPLIAAGIQYKYPELTIIWNSEALAVLIFFYFLQLQDLNRDYLTGLPNRRQGDDWIDRKIRVSTTHESFSLIMIDLDNFKPINDSYGHNEGDTALRIFSNIMRQVLKSDDKIVRFAGDEFLIILDSTENAVIESIIERLKIQVTLFNKKKIKPYQLAFSAGYTVYNPEKHRGLREILYDADNQMYENKRIKKQNITENQD